MLTALRRILEAKSAIFHAEAELAEFVERYADCDKNHPSLVSARANVARARNIYVERFRLYNIDQKIQNGYNGQFAAALKQAISL